MDELQSAVERHLDIHSYPTYKLFNREGNLLDLEINARGLRIEAPLAGKGRLLIASV
jgi:hypothetical protein